MNDILRLSGILLAVMFFTVTSCKKDDPVIPSVFTVTNFVTSIDENPINGQSLGIIQVQNSTGNLSYNISTQTPAGALSINANTGVLSVANFSFFDFESNPVITASVNVIDASNTGTSSVSINLNDIDDIAYLLSTTKAAYSAASSGSWISITETEYNNLAASLNVVSKVATSDSEYNNSTPNTAVNIPVTLASNNGHTIPSGSFVFALKYNAAFDNTDMTNIKISTTSIADSYVKVGINLPSHNSGKQFFVLKGSSTQTTSLGFLSIFHQHGFNVKREVVGKTSNWNFNEANDLPNVASSEIHLYQGLSTTQKQW